MGGFSEFFANNKGYRPDRRKERELNKYNGLKTRRKYKLPSRNSLPQIPIRKKYVKLAANRFGVVADAGFEEAGIWTAEHIKSFPLALQLTRDNFCKLGNYILDQKKYLIYHPYVPFCEEFTIEWFKEIEAWIDNHHEVSPLSLIFDLRAKNPRTVKWITWWCNHHSFRPGIDKEFLSGFISSSFNTDTYTPEELEVKFPHYDLMVRN